MHYGEQNDTAPVFCRLGDQPTRLGTHSPKHVLEPLKEDRHERYTAYNVMQALGILAKLPAPRRYQLKTRKSHDMLLVGPGREELVRLGEEHRYVLKNTILSRPLSNDSHKLGDVLMIDNSLAHVKIEPRAADFVEDEYMEDPAKKLVDVHMHWPQKETRVKEMHKLMKDWKLKHPVPGFDACLSEEDMDMMATKEACWTTRATILDRDGVSSVPLTDPVGAFFTKST